MTKDDIKQYGQWYFKAYHQIRSKFGKDAKLFSNILAATSPRKQVLANWRLAHRIYYTYKLGMYLSHAGQMPCHRGNIRRIFNGEELSGRKVSNFARNLQGDWDAVTVDTWTSRYFGISSLTDKTYSDIEKRIRRIARYHGVTPCETQATAWCLALIQSGRSIKEFGNVL